MVYSVVFSYTVSIARCIRWEQIEALTVTETSLSCSGNKLLK